MKYLKYIEKYITYSIGDYIVLWYNDMVCEIIDVIPNYDDFKIIMNIDNKKVEIIINYVNIKRKATPEEIEKFKMEIETNKYNI